MKYKMNGVSRLWYGILLHGIGRCALQAHASVTWGREREREQERKAERREGKRQRDRVIPKQKNRQTEKQERNHDMRRGDGGFHYRGWYGA